MQNQIQHYRIVSQIGAGGMGSVYLAEDEMLDRKVAIKVLNPLLTSDAHFRDRFRQEARLQASLIHSHIVALHSFFEDNGSYCMVMEYAEGETLKQMIERTGPVPEERAIRIFGQMLEAVGYAHSRGIVHRDLKPSNVIVSPSDEVKIMDFGIAKLLGEKGMTRTGTKMGTLYYMSPEQVKNAKDIDARTDVYSLGMTLYEMLAGRLPFDAIEELGDFEVMTAIVNQEFPSPTHFYPHISENTGELVRRSLMKKREDRIGSTSEMLNLISEVKLALPRSVGKGAASLEHEKRRQRVSASPKSDALGFVWIAVEGGAYTTYKEEGIIFVKQIPYEIKVGSFLMSAVLVTFEQYDRYCEETDAKKAEDEGWGRGKRPVINVNNADAVGFCNWASEKTGTTIRLPEETEWEFAARGGKKTNGYMYSGSNNIDEVAWYYGNSDGRTHEVAAKRPNELGLYDMSGNVWEWCGTSGTIRGGSSFTDVEYCETGVECTFDLDSQDKDLGFRVLQEKD